MMTRAQLRARLREALGPHRPVTWTRVKNRVQSIDQGQMLKMVRQGDAIVISREVGELILEQLARPVASGTKR